MPESGYNTRALCMYLRNLPVVFLWPMNAFVRFTVTRAVSPYGFCICCGHQSSMTQVAVKQIRCNITFNLTCFLDYLVYLHNNESICHSYLNKIVTETEPNKQA